MHSAGDLKTLPVGTYAIPDTRTYPSIDGATSTALFQYTVSTQKDLMVAGLNAAVRALLSRADSKEGTRISFYFVVPDPPSTMAGAVTFDTFQFVPVRGSRAEDADVHQRVDFFVVSFPIRQTFGTTGHVLPPLTLSLLTRGSRTASRAVLSHCVAWRGADRQQGPRLRRPSAKAKRRARLFTANARGAVPLPAAPVAKRRSRALGLASAREPALARIRPVRAAERFRSPPLTRI